VDEKKECGGKKNEVKFHCSFLIRKKEARQTCYDLHEPAVEGRAAPTSPALYPPEP
jgi:hypothetical protein